MSRKSLFLKIILPFAIIAAGAAGMGALLASREPPPKEVRANPGALVEVAQAKRSDHAVRIYATGTVQARRETSLAPQVSGRIVSIAPDLVAGGLFRAGEELFAIEELDYRLAVERAEAALTKAELDLQTVEGQARIARMEWDRLKREEESDPSPLVLYEPQLKNAQANVASARAQLEQARLDLARTRVEAPFDSRVSSEQIDLGQYVRAGNSVATLAGTDRAEVIVPLPVEELGRVRVPRAGQDNSGSTAVVTLTTGDRLYSWKGRITRSLGEVDPRGRMARVVVQIDDPHNLQGTWPAEQPALEPGMFVQAELHGETLSDVVAIPRSALRGNNTVWVAASDNTLDIRPVEIVRREQETLILRSGLEEGDRLILTPLAGAAQGMKLRVRAGGRG